MLMTTDLLPNAAEGKEQSFNFIVRPFAHTV
jgi:hypothetical protein